ncbi:MAG: HEAT repeat domain-containing protein [Acidobacteria bacterium]|nr:HEAT repeat domain-containing protein [Acidobacteriota bacterium]
MLWLTLRQLKSSDAIKRAKAAEKLVASRNAQAFEHLVTALKDTDFEVRMVSARGIGQFGERALEPLGPALKDKSSSVREAAIDSLAEIGGPHILAPESGQALEEYHRREEEAKRLAEEESRNRLTCVNCKRKSDKLVFRQGKLADGYVGFGQCPKCQRIWCSKCWVQDFGEADVPDFLKRALADVPDFPGFGKIGMVTNQCPKCKEILRPPRVP